MNCRELIEKLDALVDDELSPAERERVEAHAVACAACHRELEALRLAEQALRVPEFRTAPPGMLAAFHRRLGERPAPRRAFAWPWMAGSLAAAAAAAALVLVVRPPAPPDAPPGVECARGPERLTAAASPVDLPAVPSLGVAASPAVTPPSAAASPASPSSSRRDAPALELAYHAAPALESGRLPNAGGPGLTRAALQPPAEESASSLSPALVNALNRTVTVSLESDSPREAVAALGEAADVAVQVDAAARSPVSYQASEVPLWQALEAVARQSRLVIEPEGDGLRLAMRGPAELEEMRLNALPQGPRAGAAADRESMGRTPAAGGRGVAARKPSAPPAGRVSVWSAAFGDLPEQGFAASDEALAQLQQRRAPDMLAATPRAQEGVGGGGLGGFGAQGPGGRIDPARGVPGRSRAEDLSARRARREAAGGRSEPPPAPRPQPAAESRAAKAADADGAAWHVVPEGRVLLLRSGDGERHGALLPVGRKQDAGVALYYQLWVEPAADGREKADERPPVATLRAGENGRATIQVAPLGGVLEWSPAGPGKHQFRAVDDSLGLSPTDARSFRGLQPADRQYRYR